MHYLRGKPPDRALFNRNQHLVSTREAFDQIFIQWFCETGVCNSRRQTVPVELLGSLDTVLQPRPIG